MPTPRFRLNWGPLALFLLLFAVLLLWSGDTASDSLIPPSAARILPDPIPSAVEVKVADPLPRLLHFAYARPAEDAQPLSFVKWLSMTSAVVQLRPSRVLIHCEAGFSAINRKLLQVVEHDPVIEVYGNPINVLAHKTDVLRLDGLYNHGGVYLDSDVFVFHDFLVTLNDQLQSSPKASIVLGQEHYGGVETLGNSVIIARQFSPFIALWKRGYHDFDDNEWSLHSTSLPLRLSRQHPGLVHELPKSAFYSPSWDPQETCVATFLREDDPASLPPYDFEAAGALGWHWWGHIVEHALGPDYSPCTLLAQANRTVISRLMGSYVTPELCLLWQHHKTTLPN
jgi:hypothetical protein